MNNKHFAKFPKMDRLDSKHWRLIYLNDYKFIHVRRCGIFNAFNFGFFALVAATTNLPLVISQLFTAISALPVRDKLIISVAPVMYTHILIKTINFRRRTMIRMYRNNDDPNKYILIWYNSLMRPEKIILNKEDFLWQNHQQFTIQKKFTFFEYNRRFENEFQCYLNEKDFHDLRA